MQTNVKRIATCGMLVALGFATLWIIRIPIFPSASFLRLDVKDVFIAIMGIMYGPLYAFCGALCMAILQMLSVSEYGVIGLVMNIISSSAFAVPISVVYRKKKDTSSLLVGLAIGTFCLIVAMLLWNYLITPLYMGVSRDVVGAMLVPIFFAV